MVNVSVLFYCLCDLWQMLKIKVVILYVVMLCLVWKCCRLCCVKW